MIRTKKAVYVAMLIVAVAALAVPLVGFNARAAGSAANVVAARAIMKANAATIIAAVAQPDNVVIGNSTRNLIADWNRHEGCRSSPTSVDYGYFSSGSLIMLSHGSFYGASNDPFRVLIEDFDSVRKKKTWLSCEKGYLDLLMQPFFCRTLAPLSSDKWNEFRRNDSGVWGI